MAEKFKKIFAHKKDRLLLYMSSFGLVFCILWIFFFRYGYAPFGTDSLACDDANIQYLDFFAYLKDVIAGKNDIGYTFTKELGGTNIASFSYYLASPFNLLVVFFRKTELHTFFDLLVSLKLSTAAVTCAVFLRNRFSERLSDKHIVLLAAAYALMQYSIAQCSNVMWLDGVYMLPLILLGVYDLIEKRKIYLLSLSAGTAILFNWYSAGIDCIFAVFWFFFEVALSHAENKNRTVKADVLDMIRFGVSMLTGVMLSAVLFLPTVSAMKDSTEGTFDWDLLKNEFMGDIVSTIQNYSLSATSTWGSVSLFCGSFGLLGCICFFFSKQTNVRKKFVIGSMLGISILFYYWVPFVLLFSLLKNAESYRYRYSYVTIFLILFIAAVYYEKNEESKLDISYLPVRCMLGFSGVLLILNYVHPVWENKYVYATVAFLMSISIFYEWSSGKISKNKHAFRWLSCCIIVLSCLELYTNVHLLSEKYYHTEDIEIYKNYTSKAAKQISEIQEYDKGNYRISQTSTRNMGSDGLTAYYNEGMSLNYMSITEYSSAPDGLQMNFLDRLGYRCEGIDMQIVTTSVIGADSLLGVKYILSPYEIAGLQPVESLGTQNGKTVYENPYALPLAFLFPSSGTDKIQYSNPFEYQNDLFSELVGEDVEIYQKLAYERDEETNAVIYTLQVPEGNYALYGNLPWNSEMNASLDLNGRKNLAYSRWLSSSVFYIPADDSDTEVTVTLNTENPDLKDEQFYALDLEKLRYVSTVLSQKKVDDFTMKNGFVSCSVEGEGGTSLFLSVPYHKGWTVLLNGEKIEPELFGGCLITIPLEAGINDIEMIYHVPLLREGAAVSILAICILIGLKIYGGRRKYFSRSRSRRLQ